MLTNNYAALTAALEAHGPSGLHFRNSSDAHESAVLIPLVKEKDGSASLLFEVRSSRLDAQPGDICFPGGRMEEGETAEETAIRETAEELLVKPSQVSILGRLDGMMGPTGGAIWPVVGELKDYDGNFSKDEVGEVFKVPLDFFLNTEPERPWSRFRTMTFHTIRSMEAEITDGERSIRPCCFLNIRTG